MRVRIIEPVSVVQPKHKRVCAYARVSSSSEAQGESLENQTAYYKNLIESNPEYEYVGVFADFGITGTKDERLEFQKMLALARAREIDLILTKSISRFARNTTLVLEVVRELKGLGIEVIFEKDNISTLTGDGELMLTVLSSFAQEESKSISENLKWRYRRKFEQGELAVNATRFLGYDKNKRGELVINPSQAKVVKRIFDDYISGKGSFSIAKELNNEGVMTVAAGRWHSSTVLSILKNEKYKGDAKLQKTYSKDYISKKKCVNHGEVDSYYIENNHPPIVSKEIWDEVQRQIVLRAEAKGNVKARQHVYQNRYPLTGMLLCSKCGAPLRRRVWNSKYACRKIVWQCSNYIKNGKSACSGTVIDDEEASRLTIKTNTIVEEVIQNGKKRYRYTSKSEQDKPCGKPAAQEKRVAAYCRVSTDQAEQLSSYEAQVKYYTTYIEGNPEHELAGIFADEGISGTSTKKREQFNKMIEGCKAGKIDMIITKSISRFARNTLDCLNFVRQLKDLGIGVTFEKENINTLDSKGEVLLSILSSLAQDESRSISENSTWGIRRRFEQGKLQINHKKFLGYDKDKDGNLVINEKQAKIVRRIYTEFLDGKGANRIAKDLEEGGVPNWNGKAKWYEGSIRKMLTNEKYKGDALLQKTYTVDFLSKKRADNTGQVPQYYVEDSHPAIIAKEMWEAVQLEMERRRAYALEHGIQKMEYATTTNPFAGRVICGACGQIFGRKVWNSTDERLRRIIWRCNGKYVEKGKKGCESRHIDDGVLYQAFEGAFNAMVENKEYFMGKWKERLESDNLLVRYKAKQFMGILEEAEVIDKFDMDLYFALVEKMTVSDGGRLIVSLLDGTAVECTIE